MKKAWYIAVFFLHACGNIGREPSIMASPDSLPPIIDPDTMAGTPIPETDSIAPAAPSVKNPSGTYRFNYSIDSVRVEHTLRFNSNQTYKLQEQYNRDSIVLSTGTWAISDGFIYTYKQQVLRSRYRWAGDKLQYINPASSKSYILERVPEITENKTWMERRKSGSKFFGVGNEPFWSIEIDPEENILFRLADWTGPASFKITGRSANNDSVYFSGVRDSILITLTILPYFCSDGMSDFVYPKKIKVNYNQQEFSGCGMLYRQP